MNTPFLVHAPEPEYADIKAGPVYVQFHSAEGLVLYDDNYQLSDIHRKSSTLVLLRLNLTVIAQLTDNLQLAITGGLDYLPIQNQIGVDSFIDLALLEPALAAQLVYDTTIAGNPVRFADDFDVGRGDYSGHSVDNFDLFQGDLVSRDENGRYSFHNFRTNQSLNAPNDSLIYYSNTVSALTDRLLPDDIRLTVRAEHQNFWYNQSNRGLPASRDDFLTSLVSERPNERFKPYLSYEATRVENNPGVIQSVRAGFFGPIDDQLFLQGEAGYFVGTRGSTDHDMLYKAILDHTAGPYTSEHFAVGQDLTYLQQEEITYEYYRLDQTLGPTVTTSLFAERAVHHDFLNDNGSDITEYFGGLQLVWYVGPRTSLYFGGIYSREGDFGGGRSDTITGRAMLNYTFTDSLLLQLLYQYQHCVSNASGQSYYDNLVYLRLVKMLH